jgi:DNA-binding transcriptional LysR family regulator
MHSVRHLELVRALARHRHFGRAAEAMGVSQPSLTRGLRYLETTLGAQLFDCVNPITPTAFGEIILRHGELVLGEFSELLREVELLKGLETGALSVCTGPYPADISALEALGRLSRKYPNLACTLLVKDGVATFEDVARGQCDLGVVDVTDVGQYPELDAEVLRKTALDIFWPRRSSAYPERVRQSGQPLRLSLGRREHTQGHAVLPCLGTPAVWLL